MSDLRADPFQQALDEVAVKASEPNGDGSASTGAPRVHGGVAFGPRPSSGGEARFDLALDWTDEPTEELSPSRPVSIPLSPHSPDPPSCDLLAEIALELGLDAPATLKQLKSRWRDFVWRNHPDRQPLAAQERATARMAVANTLYERARRELGKAR